jgi:3-hydroxyisobutyrate dehydrogenase-like beta-hydroxyacid dehydrogenase
VGNTPRAVAEANDVVFTMVTNTSAARRHEGVDGILGLSTGKIYVDMSTVSPAAIRATAKQVEAKGAAMLDAPVSGSVIPRGRQAFIYGRRQEGSV